MKDAQFTDDEIIATSILNCATKKWSISRLLFEAFESNRVEVFKKRAQIRFDEESVFCTLIPSSPQFSTEKTVKIR